LETWFLQTLDDDDDGDDDDKHLSILEKGVAKECAEREKIAIATLTVDVALCCEHGPFAPVLSPLVFFIT